MARFLLGILVAFAWLGAVAARAQDTQPAGVVSGADVVADADMIRRGETDGTAASGTGRSLTEDAFRVVGSLAVVLGLIGLMYWGTRRILPRMPAGRRGSGVTVLATAHISPKQKILLIRVGRRVLAVGDGGGGQLNTLCEVDDPDEVAALIGQIHGAADDGAESPFTTIFSAARKRAVTSPPVKSGDEVEAAREQLDGLMQQVRGITRQIDQV